MERYLVEEKCRAEAEKIQGGSCRQGAVEFLPASSPVGILLLKRPLPDRLMTRYSLVLQFRYLASEDHTGDPDKRTDVDASYFYTIAENAKGTYVVPEYV